MYVYHPFMPICIPLAILTLFTATLAALSWRVFEKPLTDLERNFPYRAAVASVYKMDGVSA
jgi:peptidoglycan/LPS O-acetylase OafA/YrhL